MGDEEQRGVLERVFGYSSSERDEDEPLEGGRGRRWEKVEEVNGLWLCTEFLDPEQQSWLLSSIDKAIGSVYLLDLVRLRATCYFYWRMSTQENEGWFPDPLHNQAMKFGDLPEWARILSGLVRECCLRAELDGVSHQDTEDVCPLPFDILCREPLFDQLIANSYEPGEGICAHVDLMRFEDGIAIVSLRSPCVMHFTQVKQEGVKNPATRVPVLLTPGSLVVMSGEARYLWKHEINRNPGFQLWEGKEIVQQRRTSVTLRKLCPQA